MRADGWNRIPLIRMTNINIVPGTWKLEDLLADSDGGAIPGHEPRVVHRQQAAQLPVRHGDSVRHQGRQARTDIQEPHLHGHHAGVLELVRRRVRPGLLDDVGNAQLRQGPTGPDRARRPRDGAGAVQERPRGGGEMTKEREQISPPTCSLRQRPTRPRSRCQAEARR